MHILLIKKKKKCQSTSDFFAVSRLISNSFHLYLRHDSLVNSLVNAYKMLTLSKHVDIEFYACLITDSFFLLLVAEVVWEYFLNLTVLLPKKRNTIFKR